MNNTAVSAKLREAQDAKTVHMIFESKEHEAFYYERLAGTGRKDCYHKALFYILGITEETRDNIDEIYDEGTGCIKPDCLGAAWQTSGSLRVVRAAFNLYTDGIPQEDSRHREAYSISDLFDCGYAVYFWQGIRLRYPEYCRKPKSMDEILMEMEERKRVKNSPDGNEERY